jgi:hypothetical protein
MKTANVKGNIKKRNYVVNKGRIKENRANSNENILLLTVRVEKREMITLHRNTS